MQEKPLAAINNNKMCLFNITVMISKHNVLKITNTTFNNILKLNISN